METFKFIPTLFRSSGNFPVHPDTLHIIWILCIASGHFPINPEIRQPGSQGNNKWDSQGLKGVTAAEYFSHLFSKITPHYWSLRLPCNILCLLFFCNCIFVCIYIDDIMGIDIWFRGRMEKGSSVTNYLQTRT